jgi:hypothetical protein
MVNPEFKPILKEFYEESIKDDLEYIRFIGEESKVLQRIRESYQDNWKIVELCREILFENAKFARKLREGIEDDQRTIKELERL